MVIGGPEIENETICPPYRYVRGLHMKEKILVCWSGGKDSSMMLYELLRSKQYEIMALITTVTEGYDRISMHGVRRALLEEQARSLGFPLEMIYITQKASNEEYEKKMETLLNSYKKKGVEKVSFGDIFLEDLKEYREKNLARIQMKGLFPIWKRDTHELVRTFIQLGFQARLTCVDTKVLGQKFAGRSIDESLLKDLPGKVDPCGENGEFHSFVYDGPIFKNKVKCTVGEQRLSERFCFRDLVPEN